MAMYHNKDMEKVHEWALLFLDPKYHSRHDSVLREVEDEICIREGWAITNKRGRGKQARAIQDARNYYQEYLMLRPGNPYYNSEIMHKSEVFHLERQISLLKVQIGEQEMNSKHAEKAVQIHFSRTESAEDKAAFEEVVRILRHRLYGMEDRLALLKGTGT